ncbi:MAG: alpha/beta hydrolase [Gemmatimonadales bacterium]
MVRTAARCLMPFLGILWWTAAGAAQVTLTDVPYGAGSYQRLDLSVPAGKGFPTVIFIHGGSLTSGDKADDDYRDVCKPFAGAGIGCASVNYRLAPAAPWPAQPEDVAGAVAWVHDSIGAYGGDPHRLFLLGHSSGALLVALMGADGHFLARHGLKPGDLRGVMPMGSIMWDEDLEEAVNRYGRDSMEQRFARDPDTRLFGSFDAYRGLWPIRHVGAGMPPFLFLIAEGERVNPPVLKTDSVFAERARALGNQADYRILPGRTHMTAIRRFSEPGDPTFAIVREFIRRGAED